MKPLQPAWVTKTIIVTEQKTRYSKAITFKNLKAGIFNEETNYSSSISYSQSIKLNTMDTFSLMDAKASDHSV